MTILHFDAQAPDLIWGRAKKTQGIRAKAMINLIIDRTVVNKFLLDTLEAKEPLGTDNMICIGAAGDAWQQTAKALLKKYEVKDVDKDGWMICEPRPENEVLYLELDRLTLLSQLKHGTREGVIIGLWGETIDGVVNCQRWVMGDFLCKQPHDETDVWIVRRNLFLNTYSVIGDPQ